MEIEHTAIPGVEIIHPKVYGDERGYFFESWNSREFDTAVRPVRFCQDNESRSCHGVIRGLHYQKGAFAQSKLVRVLEGRVLDVALDIRVGSPTFGQYVAVELSPSAVFQYKCDNSYAPQQEAGIAWNDPAIGIDWKIPAAEAVLSAKDRENPLLKDCPSLFDYSKDLYI